MSVCAREAMYKPFLTDLCGLSYNNQARFKALSTGPIAQR